MAVNGIEMALNTLGSKIYLSECGVAPKVADQLKAFTKLSNPRSTKKESVDYVDCETGWKKHVPTNSDAEETTIEIANEDEATITKLEAWADVINGDGIYKDLTVVLPAKDGWTHNTSYTQTVFMTGFKWNDVDGNSYQGYQVTMQPNGKPKKFSGTITE